MTTNEPDPMGAAARALERIMGGGPRGNRAARRRHRGTEPGSGKHPLGATKPHLSERKAKRRRKR